MLYCNGSPCQIGLTQDKIFTTLGTERCNQGVILLLSQNVLLPLIQLWSSRLQWLWQDHAVALHPGSSEIGEWSGYYPGSPPRVQGTQHTWQGCWVHATGGKKHCRQLASSPGHLPDFISQPWRKIRRRPRIKSMSRTGNGGLG